MFRHPLHKSLLIFMFLYSYLSEYNIRVFPIIQPPPWSLYCDLFLWLFDTLYNFYLFFSFIVVGFCYILLFFKQKIKFPFFTWVINVACRAQLYLCNVKQLGKREWERETRNTNKHHEWQKWRQINHWPNGLMCNKKKKNKNLHYHY